MILIVANRFDRSTSEIVRWLSYYKQNFVWIDEMSILRGFKASVDFSEISVGDRILSLDQIKSVWWRRPFLFYKSEVYDALLKAMGEDVTELVRCELYTIVENLLLSLKDRNLLFLGNESLSGTNKLQELQIAKDVGFLIPPTIITSNKRSLMDFYLKYGACISKSLYNGRVLHIKDFEYEMHTHEITREILDRIPTTFTPSLIQKKIDKKFEMRVFYLNCKLYATAIFSQSDESTALDWRKGQKEKPSRFFAISVDQETEMKITKFMKLMKLRIGSLDFIVDKQDTLYFLEVNHEGQFDMLVSLCHYDIYKYIARSLILSNKNYCNEASV